MASKCNELAKTGIRAFRKRIPLFGFAIPRLVRAVILVNQIVLR